MVLLAEYHEVSTKYDLGAGSVLLNKNRAAMTLFAVVSLGIQLKHRAGSELGHSAWTGTERQRE